MSAEQNNSEILRHGLERIGRPAVVVSILVCCAVAYFAGTSISWHNPQAQPVSTPRDDSPLWVKPLDLDLGEVWEAKEHLFRLPIHNRSASPIQIVDFSVSCNCTSVRPRTLTIAPGHTAEVELIIDLTHRLPNELQRAERRFALRFSPVLKPAASRHMSWLVNGVVKSRVTVDTDFLHFGELPVQGQTPIKRRVIVTTHVPADRLVIRTDPTVLTFEVERRSETQFDLTVSPRPNLPVGEFRTEIGVDVLAPTGQKLPGMSLPIAGTMQPEVRMLPARVFLGVQPLGTSVEAVILMQPPAGVRACVERIETDTTDVVVEATEAQGIEPGRAFRMVQAIRQSGDRVSIVWFFVRKNDQPTTQFTVEVHYVGAPKNWTAQSK